MPWRSFAIPLLAAILLVPTATASARRGNPVGVAGNRFARQHPRRDEVNMRVARQRYRIAEGVDRGKLSPAQARQLEANDNAIKRQEHADVRANGGFLTRGEDRQLNQEENANSKMIRADKHPAPK